MARALSESLWRELTEDITTGMREWRIQHPKATLREIETELDARLARTRARMLEDLALQTTAATWQDAARLHSPTCPHCGSPLDERAPIPAPYSPTVVRSSRLTEVTGSARPAPAGFSPLDDELGLLPGPLTPRLQEGLVRLSTHIPSFGKAAVEFAYWTQVTVHRTTAARITEAAGATAVALQTRAAEHILQTHPLPLPQPDQLVFSVDGAMVPLLHGRWAEARTLAVGEPFLGTNAEGQAVVQTTALSYFSRLTDSTSFGELATVEIHRRGVERAKRVGAVVDGAEWCQTFIDLHAPQAVRILDFPHAAEYVEAIGQTVGAGGPLLPAAERTSLCQELKHSGPTIVMEQLRTTVAQAGTPGETASQLAYLEKRVAQMDYPAFREQQWPIGSGMVESANKLVVEERLKGAGMHWAEAHVDPMLALRNAICSDRWAEVWAQIEQAQRRAERERRRERQRRRQVAVAPQQEVCSVAEVSERRQRRRPDGERASVREVPEKAAERGHPSADHPWRNAWSIRRQRELASTA